MAEYQQYVAALAGRTIQNDYLFKVEGSLAYQYVYGTPDQVRAESIHEYRGGPINLTPTTAIAQAPVVAVDAAKGLFSIGSITYQFVGASNNGQQLLFRPADQGQFQQIGDNEYYTGADLYAISNTGPVLTETTIYDTHNVYQATSPLCFLAGTRIRTGCGEVAVEDLRVGDLVPTLAHGRRRVVWLGWGTAFLGGHDRVVTVRAGALGQDSPSRDLRVSGGHGLLVGGVLIPADALVDGVGIVRDEPGHARLFHVELDRHAVLWADGAAVESYRDAGNRRGFAHQQGTPGAARALPTCVPVVSSGPIVERARCRLSARAALLDPPAVARRAA